MSATKDKNCRHSTGHQLRKISTRWTRCLAQHCPAGQKPILPSLFIQALKQHVLYLDFAENESRHVDLDKLPVYKQFQFSCSRNTTRIYLYDEVAFQFHYLLSIRAVPVKKNYRGGEEKILLGVVSRIQFFFKGVVQVVN